MHCGFQFRPRASLVCSSRRPSRSSSFRCNGTGHLRCCASPQDRPDGDAAPSEPPQSPQQNAAQHPEAERIAGRQQGAQPEEDDELTMPLSEPTTDWREFRARLVAGSRQADPAGPSGRSAEGAREWAHPVARPEKGCLLLAHPRMFADSQTYFNQAVVFILEHSEESSVGLILNKPTEFLVHQVLGAEDITPEFKDNRIFLGGDVGLDTTFLLHPHGQLPESVEIVNGVFMGGCNAARAAVREGHKKAQDFKWHARYAGWGPGQLQGECSAGCWLLAAASKGVILEQGLHNRAMWHHVLELMGGDHELLSKWVKKQYPKDMLEKILRNDESP